MSCPECEARRALMRQALIDKKITEAVVHAAKGVAEAVGIKPRMGIEESRRSRLTKPEKGDKAQE